MKSSFLAAFLLSITLFAAARSSAQVYARDDAANYTNSPGNAGWIVAPGNTNGGFGFQPWVYQRSGSNFQGYYVGNGGEGALMSTNNNFLGMYANGPANDNASVAFRSFSNSMPANSVFKIKYRPRGIGNTANKMGGFALRNGTDSSTTNWTTGLRFAFYYQGGGSDTYAYFDANGPTAVDLGFGTAPFLLEFTLLGTNNYRLVVKDASGVNTLATIDNQPLAASGTLDSVALFAFQTDGDQLFNNLEISSTSLIPPDIQNVSPTNGSIYVDAPTTQLNFDVTSLFSTVATNQIKLSLNGVNQTNLTFSGNSTSWHVVLTSALASNITYNGVITAQDANGNRSTNNFTFNTWRSDLPFVEAEDYNFSSGRFILPSFPDGFNQYAGLAGSNGVDYLEYDNYGTTNAYRTGDLPDMEVTADQDHAGYAGFSLTDYNLSFIKNGEWQNYTRVMTNVVYDVYARMSCFGPSATVLFEHLASPTATSSNQPRASLGTFVSPNTGGAQNWNLVQLKDISSNPVRIRFSSTNTFRTTSLAQDQSYNLNYLVFVPSTNTATLRPVIASGFPFPNVTDVLPNQLITFTIGNRETAVIPGTITVTLNGSNVTSSIVLSNNAAGSVVTYQPTASSLLPAGTNTIQVVFSDGALLITNTWQFMVVALQTIPQSEAIPLNQAGLPGFALQIAKAVDTATNIDFPPKIARVISHLAGTITNAATGQPYPNLAAGPNNDGLFNELGTINYDINGSNAPNSTFNFKTNFPYVPASGTNNFISLAATMYVQLTPGVWTFAVRSDDGFQVTTGPTPGTTNLTLGEFDAGRGNDETVFSFIVPVAGLYPMRLIYDQGEFGGNVEFYSKQNGQNILINDPNNPNSVKAYRTIAVGVTLLNPTHSGNTSTFSFLTQSGKTHTVEYKNALTNATWQALTNITGTGTTTNVVDTTANGSSRFYRVNTQ